MTRETPYEVSNEQFKGTQPRRGTLHIGRVVWTGKPLSEVAPDDQVESFVNGVGLVQLNARDLKTH